MGNFPMIRGKYSSFTRNTKEIFSPEYFPPVLSEISSVLGRAY